MTILVPQDGAIPVPQPGAFSRYYWEGCAEHELRYQRCGECNGATHTPAVLCAACASLDIHWERSAGIGEIYSWTVVWRPATPAFVVPYVPIVVTMLEGWQLLSALVGCEPEAAEIGMAVEVEFHRGVEGFTLPYFRPVEKLLPKA